MTADTAPGEGFAHGDERADVAVVIVTFNNSDHLEALISSLRHENTDLRLRVIAADNGSTDSTRALLAEHDDIITVETGGNVGYADGINAAMRAVGNADALLVLNPDLVIEPGAVRAMIDRMTASGAGVVVPRILDEDGTSYHSIRREPSVTRTLGDALLGNPGSSRPSWSSEIDVDEESYRHAHTIDWATGAALLVNRGVADAVGRWDGRFFLYSEETDFFRRVRDAGYSAWYEPTAVVRHARGGSGSSAELASLMAVNKVRYARKHRSPGYAAAFHASVILHEAIRAYESAHRATLRVLLDQKSWRRLPKATRWPVASAKQNDPSGSIIIPAHNEERVIARTLRTIGPMAETGGAEVIVVCNGCTDNTASIAREFPGVRVIELAESSKTMALNAGDDVAGYWPRLYLDADIEIHPGAVAAVFAELSTGNHLAARPAFRYVTSGASALVRAYYRARSRIPSAHASLWGAGAYAVSEKGHAKFGTFPSVIADDLFVDQSFAPAEKRVIDCEPVRVRTPSTTGALIAVLTRQRRGNLHGSGSSTGTTARQLLATITGPLALVDAFVYAALTIAGRRSARISSDRNVWERDESSR